MAKYDERISNLFEFGGAYPGISYWADEWFHDQDARTLTIDALTDCTWEDLDKPNTKRTVSYSQLYQAAVKLGKDDDYAKEFAYAEDYDYDSDLADRIIQQAVFGEIVFG